MGKDSAKRSPLIALVLSIFTPGLGHIYNGKSVKGGILFSLIFLPPLLFGQIGLSYSFIGFAIHSTLEIGLRLYIISDAVLLAVKQKDFELKPYNKWYYHLIVAIVMMAITWSFPINAVLGVQSFSVKSPSMEPNLMQGDLAVADIQIENHELDYGDIVVFSSKGGEFQNCRVVGLPNDTIQLKDDFLIINRQEAPHGIMDTEIYQGLKREMYWEILPNGRKINIYKYDSVFHPAMISSTKEQIIPSNAYFVIGDNRDNALDSRYQGFIFEDQIIGQLLFTYWGETTDRIGVDLSNK